MNDVRFRVWMDGKMCFPGGEHIAEVYFDGDDWEEDENGILMQFVGVFDVDGKPIYEGDVLGLNGRLHQVVRVPGGFAINIFPDEVERPVFYEAIADRQACGYVRNCRIVGNVHENPELLKNTPLFRI